MRGRASDREREREEAGRRGRWSERGGYRERETEKERVKGRGERERG